MCRPDALLQRQLLHGRHPPQAGQVKPTAGTAAGRDARHVPTNSFGMLAGENINHCILVPQVSAQSSFRLADPQSG